jgi:SNARE associated Golgi protein
LNGLAGFATDHARKTLRTVSRFSGMHIGWHVEAEAVEAARGEAPRLLGRPFVERMVPASHWERMSLWSQHRGAAVLLVARLIPMIAFNLINYVAALTEMSWWSFLWATGLGILPLVILPSVLGNQMLTMPLWVWVLLGALAIASWLVMRRRRGLMPSVDVAK